MIDVAETAKAVGSAVGVIFGGGGVWAFMAARQRIKRSGPAQITTSQAELAKALGGQTQILLEESAKDRRDLKKRLDHQGRQISRLSKDVAECQTKHLECELKASELKIQVETLLRNSPIATYPQGGANAAD